MEKAEKLAKDIITDGFSEGWREKAACRGKNPDIFFPWSETDKTEIGKTIAAKEICSQCVVIEDCLLYALETNQFADIWGGETEKDRKAIRRKWLAQKRRRDTEAD